MKKSFNLAWRFMVALLLIFAMAAVAVPLSSQTAVASETNNPTLLSITWLDNDTDGQISAGDDLIFLFSEAMDTSTIDNIIEVNERLNSSADSPGEPPDEDDYGIIASAVVWSAADTKLTVTLGTEAEDIFDGGETVNPTDGVKDKEGNIDATTAPGPAIPLPPDTTLPTLLSITWIDNDGDGLITAGDDLVFHFSEAMDTTTVAAPDTDLPTSNPAGGTYGVAPVLTWSCGVVAVGETKLTVRLGATPTIVSGMTINPAATVTDTKGNSDDTQAPAPAVPLEPDTTQPYLMSIGWTDPDVGGVTTGDTLIFNFSESMDDTTITNVNVNTVLDSADATGTQDYGTNPTVSWNIADTQCSVTIGTAPAAPDELIESGDHVDPAITVTDRKSNGDDTTSPGPAVPASATGTPTEETTNPTLLSITWNDLDGDGNYSPGDDLVFNFSEAMDTAAISTTNVESRLPVSPDEPGADYGTGGALAVAWDPLGTSTFVTVTLGDNEKLDGGDAVNPSSVVTDWAGNTDATSTAPTVPLEPDLTKPTLLSVCWDDTVNDDGIINQGDTLIFNFSEAMDDSKVVLGNEDIDLQTNPPHSYGLPAAHIWTPLPVPAGYGNTVLSFVLGATETITGGETVNPDVLVTDSKGNSDNTSSPAIPLPDIVGPVLEKITWQDINSSGLIDGTDYIVFHFSEAMDVTTIAIAADANALLDSTAGGATDYGTAPTVSWNAPINTECTVILDNDENIDHTAGDKVSPDATVTDAVGNSDNTPAPGPAFPGVPYDPTTSIAYSPTSLSFSATVGGSNPADKTLQIWNGGGSTMSWTASDDAAWLSLNPTSGSSTGIADKDDVTVSVNIAGLTAATYTATITITSPEANNSPQTVGVTLTVSAPDTTGPTLTSITWTDVDTSGTINVGDTLRFNFNEAIDTTTITATNINTVLPTVPSHIYGTTLAAGDLSWNTPTNTQLTVTLTAGETIAGAETVNPTATVTDVAGNPDATTAPGPAIPEEDTTGPTLNSITLSDENSSNSLDSGDKLTFVFSEAIDTATITATNINTVLPTSPSHIYGTTLAATDLSWNTPTNTQLTVTLTTGETIAGAETVNPTNAVTDVAGNDDATTAPGPAIPTLDTTGPTLNSITLNDVNSSDSIDPGDKLTFKFSEAMDKTTITETNIGTTLPTDPSHIYGTTLAATDLDWNTAETELTVTLKTGETIEGGETVNPTTSVTDVAGNADATTAPGPYIPIAGDTTGPTLDDITWEDVDDDDTINEDDELTFEFSEAIDTTTITKDNIESRLPTDPDHSYGTLVAADLDWNTAETELTVTLGSGETIVGEETVNPSSSVTDVSGNADNTSGNGPAIPEAEDITKPYLVNVTWDDVDDDGTINEGDELEFTFSEAIDTDTITADNIDDVLPADGHSYGDVTDDDLDWNTAKTKLTVTLGEGEEIEGDETVNPTSAVKDEAGNTDGTTGEGKAIPEQEAEAWEFAGLAWWIWLIIGVAVVILIILLIYMMTRPKGPPGEEEEGEFGEFEEGEEEEF